MRNGRMTAALEVKSETQAMEANFFRIDSCGLEQLSSLQFEYVRSNLPIDSLVRFPNGSSTERLHQGSTSHPTQ